MLGKSCYSYSKLRKNPPNSIGGTMVEGATARATSTFGDIHEIK